MKKGAKDLVKNGRKGLPSSYRLIQQLEAYLIASAAKIGWWPKCSDALQGWTDSVPICSVAREGVPMRVIGEMLQGKDGRGEREVHLDEGDRNRPCLRIAAECDMSVRRRSLIKADGRGPHSDGHWIQRTT